MSTTDIKELAKEILKDKWSEAIAFVVISFITLFALALAFIYIQFFGILLTLILLPVLRYNFVVFFLNFKRNERTSMLDMITQIPKNIAPAWKAFFGSILEMWSYLMAVVAVILFSGYISVNILFANIMGGNSGALNLIPIILIVVAILIAIRQSIYYRFTLQALYDGEMLLGGEGAARKSKVLMIGNKSAYLLLLFSFIGWITLVMIPTIIGILSDLPILLLLTIVGAIFLIPYIQVSKMIFYDDLVEKREAKK